MDQGGFPFWPNSLPLRAWERTIALLSLYQISFFLSPIILIANSFAADRWPIFLQNPILAKGAGNTAFWPILSGFVMTSIQTASALVLKPKFLYRVECNSAGPSNEFPSASADAFPRDPVYPRSQLFRTKLHFYPKGHKKTQAHSQKEEIEISVESGESPLSRAVGKGGKKVWIGC